jgi:putative addiction module component (TIGR02574 family)
MKPVKPARPLLETLRKRRPGGASRAPLSADQCAELHRRRAEHAADPSSGVPWEQVRAELLADRR